MYSYAITITFGHYCEHQQEENTSKEKAMLPDYKC